MILNDVKLRYGKMGDDVFIIDKSKIPDSLYLNASQVLCGTNKTRDKLNKHIRDLKGFKDKYPVKGDKLLLC